MANQSTYKKKLVCKCQRFSTKLILLWIINYFKMLVLPGLFFIIFVFSKQFIYIFDSKYDLLMPGFERQISGVGTNCSTNCATTTSHWIIYFINFSGEIVLSLTVHREASNCSTWQKRPSLVQAWDLLFLWSVSSFLEWNEWMFSPVERLLMPQWLLMDHRHVAALFSSHLPYFIPFCAWLFWMYRK